MEKKPWGKKKQINSAQFLHILELEETGRAFVKELKERALNKPGRCLLLSRRRLPALRRPGSTPQRRHPPIPLYSPPGALPAGQPPKTSEGSRREQQAAGPGGLRGGQLSPTAPNGAIPQKKTERGGAFNLLKAEEPETPVPYGEFLTAAPCPPPAAPSCSSARPWGSGLGRAARRGGCTDPRPWSGAGAGLGWALRGSARLGLSLIHI